ncbi:Fic family protein [Simkania sp.]|uniref:Fic family protein n=1 Tax=Simkania sp. TaxID=34094 RepID=UPI003B52FFA7
MSVQRKFGPDDSQYTKSSLEPVEENNNPLRTKNIEEHRSFFDSTMGKLIFTTAAYFTTRLTYLVLDSLSTKDIEEFPSFFDSTTGKVLAASGVGLTTAFSLVKLVNCMTSKKTSPTIPLPRPEPLHQKPKRKFEDYVKGFVFNGFWTVETDLKYTFSRKISPSLVELKTCGDDMSCVFHEINANRQAKAQLFTTEAYNSRGTPASIFNSDGTPLIECMVSVNPLIPKNYREALEVAEKEVLAPNFADSDIEKVLKKINKALLQDLNYTNGTPIKGGVYRKQAELIRDDNAPDQSEIPNFLIERYGQDAFRIFIGALDKFNRSDDWNALTEIEREILGSVYHPGPPAKEIPQRMKNFAEEYRQKLKENDDPFALAGWVHMQIVNTHAFGTGLGRQARIMMNAELKRAGYAPIVFFDGAAYNKAIKEDHKRPGAFADYLVEAYHISLPLNDVKEFPTDHRPQQVDKAPRGRKRHR